MTIKKGIIEQNRIDNAEYDIVTNSKITVIEKTQGSYVEYLIKRDYHSQLSGGQYMSDIREEHFTVYHGKTIAEIMALLDVTEYTWTTPLAEVV